MSDWPVAAIGAGGVLLGTVVPPLITGAREDRRQRREREHAEHDAYRRLLDDTIDIVNRANGALLSAVSQRNGYRATALTDSVTVIAGQAARFSAQDPVSRVLREYAIAAEETLHKKTDGGPLGELLVRVFATISEARDREVRS